MSVLFSGKSYEIRIRNVIIEVGSNTMGKTVWIVDSYNIRARQIKIICKEFI